MCEGHRTIFKELVLSFHHVGPVAHNQGVEFDGRSIYS